MKHSLHIELDVEIPENLRSDTAATLFSLELNQTIQFVTEDLLRDKYDLKPSEARPLYRITMKEV